jgi:carbon monoxide dehydrogenase subunit G
MLPAKEVEMPHIEQSALISAAPEAVWDVVSDPQRAPDWMPDLDRRELLSPGTLAIGAHWRDHGRLRKKTFQSEYVITMWEPPTRLAYQQVSGRESGYLWDERVEIKSEDSGTRVTIHLEYMMPGGLLAKVYERFIFRKDYQITLENRLDALAECFEEPGDQPDDGG